jgi:hypothetical protein
MEAKIRLKDNRNIPHLDLCRPFAAHCIGYPVVTLGFGFKSYIGYRIRQRKQREIAKENEFYMQLLQQALPQEVIEKSEESVEANDTSNTNLSSSNNTTNPSSSAASTNANNNVSLCKNTHNHHNNHHNHNNNNNSQQQSKVNANGSIDSHSPSSATANLNHNMNGSVNTSLSSHKQHNVKKNADKENGFIQQNHSIENNHQEIIPNNAILSSSKPSTKAANHLNYNNLQSVKNTNTTSYQNGIASPMKELNVTAKCSPYKNKDDHNTYIATNNKKEYEKEKIIKDTNYEEASSEVVPSQKSRSKDKQQHKDNATSQQYLQQHQPNASNHSNHNSNNHNSNNANHLNNEKNKVCDQCQRLEQETKRLKSEVQTMKSLEQEVRQKYDNIKGSLQSKQKENDELQKQ